MTALLEAPSSADEIQSTDPEPDRVEIERRAYFRYLQRGRVDGFALDDWIAAEAEFQRGTGEKATAQP